MVCVCVCVCVLLYFGPVAAASPSTTFRPLVEATYLAAVLKEFHHVTGDTLQMFKVKGQRSRSHVQKSKSQRETAAKTLQYDNG